MARKVLNILIASVGGQGGLTLSRVIAAAAVAEGLSVRTGETLGMAQRFGSVMSFVRVGEEVTSPLFGPGEADVFIGMELVEALRRIRYVRVGGVAVAALTLKPPVSSSLGIAPRPSKEELVEELRRALPSIRFVDAVGEAEKVGNYRAANMVLLGYVNGLVGILMDESVEAGISAILRPKAVETSIRAYYRGKELVKE